MKTTLSPEPGLLWLSLRHVYSWRWWASRKLWHVPTNAERLQAYRHALPPEPGNAYPWPEGRRVLPKRLWPWEKSL